jgi:mannose-6-phosphate isomerase
VNVAKLAPARLAPIFVPRIWGARSLAPLFDRPAVPTGADPIGEVWLTGEQCRFDGGEFAGRTLAETWPALPTEWTGTRLRDQPRIPLLVKFIFPEDKLSVQVHPDDEYARAHEGPNQVGKTEMWYAVSAREGAELRLGLEPGVTRESFRRAIDDGTAERRLRSLPVHAGDAFFVPAGMAHTIGPGMVICEVQQHSDITYRVFDYNRLQPDGTPRPLHIRQALDVLRFGESCGGKVAPLQIRRGSLLKTCLAACRYFATERWDFSERVTAATSPERFELLLPISGRGRIECDGTSVGYGPADAWMVPAALGAYQLAPESQTTLLRTFVPDLKQYAQELADQGADAAALSRVVHP